MNTDIYLRQQTIMTEGDDSTHSTSSKSTPPLNAGELQQLLQTLDDDEEPVHYENYNNDNFNNDNNNIGLIWYATIVPDEFLVQDGPTLQRRGLHVKDFDLQQHSIKPRRPSLPMTASDLFTSLTKIDGPRWIFHGMLNGWPSLTTLELIAIQMKRPQGSIASPKDIMTGQLTWMHRWDVTKEGSDGIDPPVQGISTTTTTTMTPCVYRATFRGPPWSSTGWSRNSPGFAYWFESHLPRMTYGTNLLHTLSHRDQCTMVHMMSHRYAVERESPRDKLTYHSIVLLEWNHGHYCTVVEGAYLNGIAGYRGRSNWYHDKDDILSSRLYQSFPPEMVGPWLTTSAEIRCFDVEAKNLDDFKAFVYQYEGKTKRFVDPHFHFSHSTRITFRSKANIAAYLLNYIRRDCSYSDRSKNCQTLAADLCGLLAGKKGIVPFHPVSRIEYRDRKHLFLYDSIMYKPIGNGTTKNK